MTSKDFAAVPASKNLQHTWVTDKGPVAREAEMNKNTHSISKRLGKAMKGGLGKIMASKPETKNSAQLEFPELEVLPTKEGYKDLKALDRSIETLKSSQRAKLAINPALAMAELENQSKQSLSKTLSAQMQEAEHARHDSADETTHGTFKSEDFGSVNEASTVRPVTPANLITLPAGDSTTATTERWATPASRLSYSPSLRALEGSNSDIKDDDSTADNLLAENGASLSSEIIQAPSAGLNLQMEE